VDRPADLADRDIVITSVAGSQDFADVTTGPDGVLANGGHGPKVVIDSSTVSMAVSEAVRAKALEIGTVSPRRTGQRQSEGRESRTPQRRGLGSARSFRAVPPLPEDAWVHSQLCR